MLMFERVIMAKLFIYQISFKLINWMGARIRLHLLPNRIKCGTLASFHQLFFLDSIAKVCVCPLNKEGRKSN